MHEKLHKFRNLHYTARTMTLVLQSQDTLDTLESLAVDMFSKVPNNGPLRETFDQFGKPFDIPEFHKIYKIVPVENYHGINLSWALPPLMDKQKFKPLQYSNWIIEHEGRGSLLSFLKSKVLALGLDCDYELFSTHSEFHILIDLTENGFRNVDEVLRIVFR